MYGPKNLGWSSGLGEIPSTCDSVDTVKIVVEKHYIIFTLIRLSSYVQFVSKYTHDSNVNALYQM